MNVATTSCSAAGPRVHAEPQPLVRVESVSKKFCRTLRRSLWYGVCDIATELNPFSKAHPLPERTGDAETDPACGRSGLRRDEFWAVNDVSFNLHRGECLGLIGKNGAG